MVRDYIKHYSREDDRVLDPFGGSGVTAIEAFLENRVGIQNDINPLANFIAKGIANLAEGRAESRGGPSIFSIYRYKIAAKPVELPPWATFQERALNVLAAKSEVDVAVAYRQRTGGFTGRFEAHDYDIDALPAMIEPVDYIFTDPPYGGHISYIDLSTLWNVWNGTLPSRKARQRELIVGGDLGHSDELYTKRLRESIEICFSLLKPRRWLSVVFQHWSTAYFDAILTGAASAGGDLRAAISQIGDPVWSMHKKKNKESVLAGEMILTFFKTGKPKVVEVSKAFDLAAGVRHILAESPDAVYGEYLFNRIIIDAWNAGALGSLDMAPRAEGRCSRGCDS